MEQGKTLDEAIVEGQAIGIPKPTPPPTSMAGTQPSRWRRSPLLLMGHPAQTQQVDRTGIREITPKMLKEAQKAGERWKLVCSAQREGERLLEASVKPARVSPESPLYAINGTSSYVEFKLDVLPGLGIVESNPGPDTTAYGMLADLLNALRGQ